MIIIRSFFLGGGHYRVIIGSLYGDSRVILGSLYGHFFGGVSIGSLQGHYRIIIGSL